MALDPCVRIILCPLGSAVIGAVNSLISLFLVQIDAQILAAQALLIQVNVIVLPARAAAAAAQLVLNEARSAADIIPSEIIGDCLTLGTFKVDIRRTIEGAMADVADFKRRAELALSFEDELEALIDELNAIRARYADFQLELTACEEVG